MAQQIETADILTTRFCALLRQLREQRGLTQDDLSERIGKSGTYINQIESRKLFPSDGALKTIENVLHLTRRERELIEWAWARAAIRRKLGGLISPPPFPVRLASLWLAVGLGLSTVSPPPLEARSSESKKEIREVVGLKDTFPLIGHWVRLWLKFWGLRSMSLLYA